jgi:hypothetical protein
MDLHDLAYDFHVSHCKIIQKVFSVVQVSLTFFLLLFNSGLL